MNMKTLTKLALNEAKRITGKDAFDKHTQEVAFKLACAVMAQHNASN